MKKFITISVKDCKYFEEGEIDLEMPMYGTCLMPEGIGVRAVCGPSTCPINEEEEQ